MSSPAGAVGAFGAGEALAATKSGESFSCYKIKGYFLQPADEVAYAYWTVFL
jgi:hypothetical protein